MADELEGLEFTITAESDDAIKHLDDLTQKLTALKGAVGGQKKLSNLVGQLRDLRSALEGFNADGFAGLANATTALSNLRISSTIGKNLGSLVSSASRLDDATVSRIERFGSALQNIAAVGPIRTPNLRNTTTPDAETRTSETGTVQATRGVTTLDTEMERGTQSASRFGSVIAGLGSSLKSLATSSDFASRGIRGLLKYTVGLPLTLGGRFASSIKESTSALGQMFSAIKRIALYRAIRSIIKEITQGLHEGISNLYQWSRVMDGEFAGAMDRLASSSLYLKNSLGAMAAPIIQALVPAINFAIDRIVALMNVINMLVSALGGKATYTAAKKMETNFANAASGAAGAAKNAVDKIKSYTIGIDELNIIHEDPAKGSGGGGGGGAGALDYSDMFETVDIDKGVSDFAKSIKDAINRKDWKSLGKLFGNKFNELIDGVRWGEIGKWFGEKISALIDTGYYFLTTADFKKLGSGFAEFFNKAIGTINWRNFGGLLVRGFTSGLDFLIGFLLNLDPVEVGTAISDFFIGGFDEGIRWLKSYNWVEVGRKLTDNLATIIENINWGELLLKLFQFGMSLQESLWEGLFGVLTPNKGSSGDKMLNVLSPLRGLTSAFAEWVSEISIENFLTPDVRGKLNTLGREMKNLVDEGFSGNAGEFNKYPINLQIVAKLAPTVSKWRSDLESAWSKVVQEPLESFTTNVKDEYSKWRKALAFGWSKVVQEPLESFKTNVKNTSDLWWANVKRWWSEKVGTLDVGVTIINNAKTWWNNVKSWWNSVVGTLTAKFELKLPKIKVTWNKDPILNKIDIPSLSLVWNAKGGILDGAQIFGMLGNTLLGGGEAGAEALLPLEKNTGWMDTIATKVKDTMTGYTLDTSGGVSRILERLDAIEAVLNVIGVDTRRTAEKPDNTTVVIGSKALRDATRRQAAADGYSFA